jgi:YidC/Oxa1 family membrane protein insertase
MEKRAIIAIVLSILVLILYQRWTLKQQPTKREDRKEIERIEPERSLPEAPEKKIMGEAGEVTERAVSERVTGEERRQLRDVTVETKLYTATFSSYGGRLKGWRLHQYENRVEEGPFIRKFQETVRKVKGAFGFGGKPIPEGKPEPVEMVTTEALKNLPLAIEIQDEGVVGPLGPMDVDRDGVLLGGNAREGTLLFRGRAPGGLEVSKRYRFFDGEYRVKMEVRIQNPRREARKVRVALIWFGMTEQSRSRAFAGPVAMVNGKVEEIKEKKFKEEPLLLSGVVQWFGSSLCGKNVPGANKKPFFVSLIVPKENEGASLKIGLGNGRVAHSRILHPIRSIPAGGEATFSYEFYLGPKVISLLKELGMEAEKVVSFGWFTVIAKVLLLFLNFTHKVTKNYGVDIIIISVLLKVLFWPLTRKSYLSMKEMQKVQPEMTMLREKYKDDKARLNKEMMDLYKRRKVNPLGGCLPMLVQIPIFFALYWALLGSIELRHASFILWIKDLSDRDPIYISPILMGASMVWQQKMTPSAGDPRQAKMMMLMPVVFTFLFLSFPSGLVLYWLVTNLLTIGQQYLINKTVK